MKDAASNSLRLRLIFGSAVGVILSVLLAGIFIGYLYRNHITQRFEAELDHHLEELVSLTDLDARSQPHVRQPLSDPQFNVPASGYYWQVSGPQSITTSPSLEGKKALDPATNTTWSQGWAGKEELLQRSVHITKDGQPLTITIASARGYLEEQVKQFWLDLALSMTLFGLLLVSGAALMVHFGLGPVRRLGEEIERLRNGEIARLDPLVPSEFAPVVIRFNALLEGQAQLISRARTESGNLAHNLRTPLALIADEAEQLSLAGQTQSAEFLLKQCRVMQRQIDYHLARAAAAGTRGAGTLTAVEPLLLRIISAMQRLHADRMLRVETHIPKDFRLPCDSGDLAEILSNLIDNAFKWASSSIYIAAEGSVIEIVDDGPGIPASQRDQVITVGTRLDHSTPGTGLGLAATVDLLRFYDAVLILDDAETNGLRVVVKF